MSRDQIARVRERFESEIAEHGLTVIRDDGLYRHVRCQRPGTWMYGFDLVTWPGYLAFVGDCGDFVFSRLRDMFEFFESDAGTINPDYWSEKLQAPRPDAAYVYSEDAARARITEWHASVAEQLYDRDQEFDEHGPTGGRTAFELWRALREQVLDRELHYEAEARRLIHEFEHDGTGMFDAWEWSMHEFDWQFLWCCHAIVWAIEHYRAVTAAKVPA